MTFAEYNTDTNFDDDNSSLEELVKIGLNEGKTSDEIKGSLSPKWQKSKKIGEFDSYVSKYSKPKAEEKKPTEEKVIETVVTNTTPEEKKTTLDRQSQAYAEKQNKYAESAKEEALDDIKKDSERNWRERYESSLKRADAYKQIDDHMVDQLPTFMFKRYQNGEFGDPKSSDAKLRLAHFVINGLGTALSNMGHKINKDGAQEESDFEKYQRTNLEEGMQNRWTKYKSDTEGAIKAVEKEYGNEQDARLAVEQLTRDRKANTKWNMMDQNQKVFALQVTKEIGSMLGGMDTSELSNFIAGAALTGDMSKDEVVAIGIAKIAANAPGIIANLPEGSIKDMVMGMIGGDPSFIGAGIGGMGSDGGTDGESGTTLEDGTKVNPGKTMSKDELAELRSAAESLGNKYYNGEISEEQFLKDYAKLEGVMNQHGIRKAISGGIMSADDYIKQIHTNKKVELSSKIDELNARAKAGDIKPSDYEEQFNKLKNDSAKWGASEKELKAIEKGKISSEKILKATDKKKK
jgi:hypothetical protein